MKKTTWYQPPERNKKLYNMFKDFQDVDDKVNWLKNNKTKLEEFDIKVINLVNAYMHNEWPQRRERKEAA